MEPKSVAVLNARSSATNLEVEVSLRYATNDCSSCASRVGQNIVGARLNATMAMVTWIVAEKMPVAVELAVAMAAHRAGTSTGSDSDVGINGVIVNTHVTDDNECFGVDHGYDCVDRGSE